jgi:vesicle-associated membrane protein 4
MPPKFRREQGGPVQQPEKESLLEGVSDDDDFFLRGPARPPINSGRVHRLQNQVDEVVDIMQSNIGKVMDRGEKLEDLHDKSESLSTNANAFRVKARNLQRQMWWKECRMRILLAVIVTVILIIIIVPIIIQQTKRT